MAEMKYCEYEGCSYQHEWPSKIKTHIEIVHKQKKDYHCDQCAKTYGTSFNLKRHKQMVHLQEKPFCCEICEKKYTTKQNRDVHQKQAHEKIEMEQILDNHELDTLSVNLDSELESSNENVITRRRDTVRRLIIKIPKITQAAIEVYRGGKSLQPSVLLRKLEDSQLPLDTQNYRKKRQTTNKGKNQSETLFTTFRVKGNISKDKKALKIAQAKKDFVYRYNFDWWSNRTPPWTQRKTVKTKAEVKAFPCDNNASEKKSVKKLQEINIFKHIPSKY